MQRYQAVVDTDRCTGCAMCMEVCPTGAIYLVEGKAVVDPALCHGCEACVSACPVGAITLAAGAQPAAEASRLPAVRSAPGVIRVDTAPPPAPLRSRAMPVVGTALAWAGREILPRLADLLLDRLDRRTADRQITRAAQERDLPDRGGGGGGGGGRQRRRRQRGGRE